MRGERRRGDEVVMFFLRVIFSWRISLSSLNRALPSTTLATQPHQNESSPASQRHTIISAHTEKKSPFLKTFAVTSFQPAKRPGLPPEQRKRYIPVPTGNDSERLPACLPAGTAVRPCRQLNAVPLAVPSHPVRGPKAKSYSVRWESMRGAGVSSDIMSFARRGKVLSPSNRLPVFRVFSPPISYHAQNQCKPSSADDFPLTSHLNYD